MPVPWMKAEGPHCLHLLVSDPTAPFAKLGWLERFIFGGMTPCSARADVISRKVGRVSNDGYITITLKFKDLAESLKLL